MDTNPISDTWERGDPYERYIGRWSRRIAPQFLAWLRPATGLRWLDLGCGTGALCAAILDHTSPIWVAGLEPSAGFLRAARQNLSGRAVLIQGTASALPLAAASVDVVVSGLALNFIPDPLAALGEMARVTRPGGVIAAYVWDYSGRMDLIRLFWDAARELDPSAERLDEGVRFPLCHPDSLSDLFVIAGLGNVSSGPIEALTTFASFDDFWQPFLGGQGPAPAYVMSLAATARERLRSRLHARLTLQADGSILLLARAWAVQARVISLC